MFARPIVFVLGAGASHEYGMPLGSGLLRSVKSTLRACAAAARREYLGENPPPLFNLPDPRLIASAMRVAEVADEFVSIDETLHWLSDDPEAVLLGKLAIAHSILQAERKSPLFEPEQPPPDRETWLWSLLRMATGSLRKEEIINTFANVTFINFNYDRVVESCLMSGLQYRYGCSAAETSDIISRMRTIP